MSVMSTNTRPVTPLPSLFGLIRRAFGPTPRPQPDETLADQTRARRDFLREVITRNPDAFSSEADIQAMMSLYPGRF